VHTVVESGENPISQERGPTRPSTDELGTGGHDRRNLSPITQGMQPPAQRQRPAGTVEFDNARVIAEQAARVAAFR